MHLSSLFSEQKSRAVTDDSRSPFASAWFASSWVFCVQWPNWRAPYTSRASPTLKDSVLLLPTRMREQLRWSSSGSVAPVRSGWGLFGTWEARSRGKGSPLWCKLHPSTPLSERMAADDPMRFGVAEHWFACLRALGRPWPTGSIGQSSRVGKTFGNPVPGRSWTQPLGCEPSGTYG